MTLIRIFGLTVSATMVVAIVFGLLEGDFLADGAQILGLPWGTVTLVDLYLGLAIFGAWIGVRERSVIARATWWTSLILLGNLAAGIYLTVAAFRSRAFALFYSGCAPAAETSGESGFR